MGGRHAHADSYYDSYYHADADADAAPRPERLDAFRKLQNISLCVFASLRENLFVDENELSRMIVDSAFRIHSILGPGLFESVYEVTMAHELRQRGCHVACQRAIPVIYDDVRLERGFRADVIVDEKVIVEIKSVEAIAKAHAKQLLTYLRLTDFRLGLLINFNVVLIKDGIQRVVNNL